MVSPGNFDGMVDVFDDFRPVHARELPLRHEFPRQLVAFDQLAALFIAAAFLHVLVELFGDLGSGCLAKFLAEESHMVLIWITPPFAARALIISSVMFLGASQSARQEECDANN